MRDITRADMLRILPVIIDFNKSLKILQKQLPKVSIISESIAINEKFLSYRKQLEESTDKRIPEELQSFFIKDVVGTMRMVCIMLNKWKEANKISSQFLIKDQMPSEN